METNLYIEVILPIPLSNTYTYIVPPAMQKGISTGCIVLVEFGKNKHYSGIIAYQHQIKPVIPYEIKEILAVESYQPVVRRAQLRLWEWVSQYYLCKMGEVYKAVLPSGFRTESSARYKPKTENFIQFTPTYSNENKLQEAFNKVKSAPKQEKLLLCYIEYSHFFPGNEKRDISKKELLTRSKSNEPAISGLIEKGILEIYEKDISRLTNYDHELQSLNKLNAFQQKAYGEIVRSFREKDVCLLHGVTSAGKTEIYTHLIEETLKLNKQVLFLLPEIALTAQITTRLKKFFGNKLGVYHSKINDNERVEIWNNLLNDEGYQIILGVRSSVFLPFRELGLIIVDEEHESSYKQHDPAPRYHARNTAIVMATMHGAKVILGSATPSIESFYNAQTGKYAYVQLNKRYEEIELPQITPVDIKELKRKKKMKGLFSPLLIEKMNQVLANDEQIILFQNRRGFAPLIYCKICDWIPKCKFCDVSLTYHKKHDQLICHYCASIYHLPSECPECGNKDLKPKGFGTEKVEEDVISLFPDVKVARLDTDTTKTQKAFEDIISNFEKGNIQILIGTQMISKGLDFGKVSLVGILNADSMMNFPDFRAYERAYQLMAQVSGRAGRRKERGNVILQTSHPEHPLIRMVLDNNYEGMYNIQIEERQLFRYPPFFRIIEITLKHKQEALVDQFSVEYATLLKTYLGDRLLGPYKPTIARIQSLHLRRIMLKIETTASLSTLRNILETSKLKVSENPQFKYIVIQYDVDPA